MIQSIKIKTLIYVCLVHLGLAICMTAILRDTDALSTTTLRLMLAGTALMYGSFLFAALSIWIPLQPWVARYQRAKAWRSWVIEELPTILALIPVVVAALKIFQAAWNEIKAHKDKGDLDVSSLAGVAKKFASDAETLSKDPVVELTKKRFSGQD